MNIRQIVLELIAEWALSPAQINHGNCDQFAYDLAARIPGAEVIETGYCASEDRTNPFCSLPEHFFVQFEGRYYDAEHPEGVPQMEDLFRTWKSSVRSFEDFIEALETMYRAEYMLSMVEQHFQGLPQRKENIVRRLKEELLKSAETVRRTVLQAFHNWLDTHSLEDTMASDRNRIEDQALELEKPFSGKVGDFISRVNTALWTAHQSGPMLDYLEQIMGGTRGLGTILDELSEGINKSVWDHQLREMGIDVYRGSFISRMIPYLSSIKAHYVGNCVSAFDDQGNSIVDELPWADVTEFAQDVETSWGWPEGLRQISKAQFLSEVGTHEMDRLMKKILSEPDTWFLYSDRGVWMMLSTSDVHYFFVR